MNIFLTYYGLYISTTKHDKKYTNEGDLYEDLKKSDFNTLKTQLLSLTNDINARETLKKELVKSFEEMAIANWYFINGIDYIYEAPYEYDVSTRDRRQYMPDFKLKKYPIYHEHYGIDKDGEASQFAGFESLEYVEGMKWKKQIHQMNRAIDDSKNKTYLDVSQSFWIDTMSSLDEGYLKTLEEYYFAEAYQGTLSNMYNEVADWINAKTKNYLNVKGESFRDMLQGAMYALLNTVYLKASWYYDFEEKNNTTEQFANLDKSNSRATFMNNIKDGYYYASNDYKIAALPFKDGLWFRMLLPEKGTNYAEVLKNETALNKLLTVSLDEVSADENGGVFRDEISYKLPQFKVRSEYDLVSMFTNMGVKSPFIPGLADFPRLSNGYISAAKHDAGFEANNQGVEGAAYTIIVVSKAAMQEPEPINFHCDRPFAYAVTTKEGIPVFMGEITNLPEA